MRETFIFCACFSFIFSSYFVHGLSSYFFPILCRDFFICLHISAYCRPLEWVPSSACLMSSTRRGDVRDVWVVVCRLMSVRRGVPSRGSSSCHPSPVFLREACMSGGAGPGSVVHADALCSGAAGVPFAVRCWCFALLWLRLSACLITCMYDLCPSIFFSVWFRVLLIRLLCVLCRSFMCGCSVCWMAYVSVVLARLCFRPRSLEFCLCVCCGLVVLLAGFVFLVVLLVRSCVSSVCCGMFWFRLVVLLLISYFAAVRVLCFGVVSLLCGVVFCVMLLVCCVCGLLCWLCCVWIMSVALGCC